MKNVKNIILPLALIVGTSAVSTVPVMAKTEIKFWSCFGANPPKKVLDSIFSRFEKENPGVKVTAVAPSNDSNVYFEKLMTAVAGGAAPDIAWAAPERVVGLYDACVIPVSELMKVGGKINTSSFYKGLWNTKGMYKHKNWGVPFENSNLALVYNKSMFANAGIAHPPKTWNEMTQDAIKLTNKDKRIFGYEGRYWDWYFPMWFAQKGTDFVNDAGTKVVWNEKSAVEAVRWYTDIATKYKVSGGSFLSQKAAMCISGSFEYPGLKQSKVNFGVAPLPVAEGGVPATFPTYKELLVFKNRNKTKTQYAWKLIKFLMRDEIFAEWCAATYYLPVTKGQAATDTYKKHLAANPGLEVFLDQSDDAVMSTVIKNTRTIWATFQTGVDSIISGKKTVEQALNETAKQAQALLRK